MGAKPPNRTVIEWRLTPSPCGAPADHVWTEYCIVETDRKMPKNGEARMIVEALNARKEKPMFEYRLKQTENQKEK